MRAVQIWRANQIDPSGEQVETPTLPEIYYLLKDIKECVDRATQFVKDEQAVEVYAGGSWKVGGKITFKHNQMEKEWDLFHEPDPFTLQDIWDESWIYPDNYLTRKGAFLLQLAEECKERNVTTLEVTRLLRLTLLPRQWPSAFAKQEATDRLLVYVQPNLTGEWGHIRKKKERVFLTSVFPTADSALYQEEEKQSREEHRQDQLEVRTELKSQQLIETQCLIDLRSISHDKLAGIATGIRKEFMETGGHEAVIHNPDTEKSPQFLVQNMSTKRHMPR